MAMSSKAGPSHDCKNGLLNENQIVNWFKQKFVFNYLKCIGNTAVLLLFGIETLLGQLVPNPCEWLGIDLNRGPNTDDSQRVYQPMMIDETQEVEPIVFDQSQNNYQSLINDDMQKFVNDSMPSWTKNVNISMAIKEIVANNPSREKELLEMVNKTFEETSKSVGSKEFQNILGDLSFLKNKKNVANLYATLQSQFNSNMGKSFEKILVDENVSKVFTENTVLHEDEINKYSVNDKFFEIVKMESSLVKLGSKIIALEETNDVFFNQTKFNRQRHNEITKRISNLLEKCEVSYAGNVKQSEVIRQELSTMITDL